MLSSSSSSNESNMDLESVLNLNDEAVQELQRLLTSPDGGFTPEMAFDTTPALDYLTSPMSGEQGVMEELQTPLNDPDDFATLLGPSFDFSGAPLFGGCEPVESYGRVEKAAAMLPPTASPLVGGLYTMSPHSPYINPSALTSPATMPIHDVTPPANNATSSSARTLMAQRKKGPTGTRKNLTPSSLIPEDAPIQSRNYITPSVTSRKAIPQTFARKRARSQAFVDDDDDEDELNDGPEPRNAEEAAIQAKRRQNTLAARRSRRRKLLYQTELETALDDQKVETDKWKGRAESLRAILYSTGTPFPAWTD